MTFENKKIILTALVVALVGMTGANSYINLDEGFYFEGSEIQDENRDTVASYNSIDEEWSFPVNISVEGNPITGVSNAEASDSVVPQSQIQSNYLNREGGDSMNSFLDMNDNEIIGVSNLQGEDIVDSNNIESNSVSLNELNQSKIDCAGSYC